MSNKGRLVFILQKLLFRGRTEVGYLNRDPRDISFPSEIDAIDSFRHYLNSEKEKEKKIISLARRLLSSNAGLRIKKRDKRIGAKSYPSHTAY